MMMMMMVKLHVSVSVETTHAAAATRYMSDLLATEQLNGEAGKAGRVHDWLTHADKFRPRSDIFLGFLAHTFDLW